MSKDDHGQEEPTAKSKAGASSLGFQIKVAGIVCAVCERIVSDVPVEQKENCHLTVSGRMMVNAHVASVHPHIFFLSTGKDPRVALAEYIQEFESMARSN